jgi:signal transduction histidine kinase
MPFSIKFGSSPPQLGLTGTVKESLQQPANLWRSTTTRLVVIYGSFFTLWGVLLLGLIYWETTRYMGNLIDQIVIDQVKYLSSIDRAKLPDTLAAMNVIETRHVMSFALYAADGRLLAGNIARLPTQVKPDGKVITLPQGVQRGNRSHNPGARLQAVRLPSGEMLVVARDSNVLEDIGAIILHAVFWGIGLTVIPGLVGGMALSRGPLNRVRAIRDATLPIVRGDLKQRLPVSKHGDELDMLAGIVNTMLGEIERLMTEVKGVCDNIAHDLRTPLTRLRAQLYRMQQQTPRSDAQHELLAKSIAETDELLMRFRALLRISELEDRHRRSCFGTVDMCDTLRQIYDLHAPLAEHKGVGININCDAVQPIHGDQHLLFEALSNLVSNAIKFTPPAGAVEIRATRTNKGPKIDVLDSGPGIAQEEREAVLRRFYRSASHRSEAGFGLGLSIVAAIVKLHGFTLEIGDRGSQPGARLTIYCWSRS